MKDAQQKTKDGQHLFRNIRRSFGISIKISRNITLAYAAFSILYAVSPILQNKLLGSIVNNIVGIAKQHGVAGGPSNVILFLIFSYIGIWIASRILFELRNFFDKIWTVTMDHGIDKIVLKKRTEIDLAHYENTSFQNLLQRAFSQDNWPIFYLVENTIGNLANLAVIIITSIITSGISPLLYCVAIVSAIPTFILEVIYGETVYGIWSENSTRKRLYFALKNHIYLRTEIAETKLLQITPKIIDVTDDIMTRFRKDRIKADKKRLGYSIIASVIAASGFGYVFYTIVNGVIIGTYEAGTMIFLVATLTQLIDSISSFLEKTAQQFTRNLYANDIFKVLDTQPVVKLSKNPIKLHLKTPPTIVFENVSFKYDGRDDWILRELSFTMESGEQVALVGENGAGKSTLVKLIMRIYDPTEGRILINGIDLRELDLDEWISSVSVLLQKYSLFEFNVAESIAMGRSERPVSYELAEKNARRTGAHNFIKDYTHKYRQQIGSDFDEGIEPSQGQAQKIALARTLYRLEDGFMVILDEPTAAIDPLAETEIFEQMESVTKEKSGRKNLLLITHRFNTVKGVEKIIVIEHGRVVEIGNHAGLMKKSGHYARMFKSQAKGFVEGMQE